MDALSQLLRSFRLRASYLSAWDLGAPWGMTFSPTSAAPFHYIEAGAMWLATNRGRQIRLEAGDVVVLFDGGGHRIGDKLDGPAESIEVIRAQRPEASVLHYGGSGRKTSIVCGSFVVDERESLAGSLQRLPGLVHIRTSARSHAFGRTLDLLAKELRSGEAGGDHAAALLTETLFVHVVRAMLADDEPGLASWIEGLRDPQVGAALAAIHGEPQRAWTLAALARTVGVSRSVLAARFRERLGVPPMSYLARWRLQLAARWLRDADIAVSEIVDRTGYASAAAFHRAFKREYGLAPSQYRQREREPGDRRLTAAS